MDNNDRNVLFAIFDGNHDNLNIRKYLKKRNFTSDVDISKILEKLKRLYMINEFNQPTDVGNAVATLLKLIPDI